MKSCILMATSIQEKEWNFFLVASIINSYTKNMLGIWLFIIIPSKSVVQLWVILNFSWTRYYTEPLLPYVQSVQCTQTPSISGIWEPRIKLKKKLFLNESYEIQWKYIWKLSLYILRVLWEHKLLFGMSLQFIC